jgi:hypothetical protein
MVLLEHSGGQRRCTWYHNGWILRNGLISISVSGLVGGSGIPASYPSATLAREMDAAVWTALAILGAMSLGTLFCLGARIDSLAATSDARFDRMDARFDHIDARFDALIGRMDSRFDALEARMDGFAARFDTHLDRHAT